jgi:hypothetical protein
MADASTISACSAGALCRFANDDGCGDWVIFYGPNSQFQVFNVLSAVGFAVAGASIVRVSHNELAQAYGAMLCLVSLGSASFHGTASTAGFLIDIVPMAISAGILLYTGLHALQVDAHCHGQKAKKTRLAASASSAAFAVWVPWMMMETGFMSESVWAVWAFLFGSLGTIFGAISFMIFRVYHDVHGRALPATLRAVFFVLLGLGCTVHSFISGLCAGILAYFPFHALWHLFSAVSAYQSGCVLDAVCTFVTTMETRNAAGRPLPERTKRPLCPLFLRMLKDALPSQFSM